jgi:two-component system nitrogen regulation sensor histidine kinase NtrY
MTLFSSLTNRIFFASAALAVLSIGVAIAIVNARVTREAEGELQRGLEEAARLVDQHHETQVESSLRMARLVADLPKLKAAVDLGDPPTVEPLAADYRGQVGSALLVVVHRSGRLLARVGAEDPAFTPAADLPGTRQAMAGRETTAFWPSTKGILEVVTVPILIGQPNPEILGTLSVGFAFDDRLAERFKALTDSEIAFALDGRIQAATVPSEYYPRLEGRAGSPGTSRLWLGDEEYLVLTRPLASLARPGAVRSDGSLAPVALILRSRTKRLSFIGPLHTLLASTAVVAVALAILVSYGVARTVTSPLRAITATMREMAATGDLTRKAPPAVPGRWQDEDARLLASNFAVMTDAIARFQREAGQKERLASLGRLSTVIAHEIRNPLMIIKTAIRTLRQEQSPEVERGEALRDIDGEVLRLNRLVDDVLDFARPIQFEVAPVDVNQLCQAAVASAMAGGPRPEVRLALDPTLPRIMSDGERLHGVLVNLLTNARHALEARTGGPGGGRGAPAEGPEGRAELEVVTQAAGGRVVVVVRDRGPGIAAENLPRVWEPYFTTRRGGTGLGLAIARNVVEGLGGTISIDSRPSAGTEVRIELPERPPAAARPSERTA